jgi:tetratricopeptide (TPR) repeat protein
MATISEALAIALQHHQAGRLDAAEQIYQRILQVEPEQPDALHFMGVLNAQLGRHQAAVDYITRAIAVRPNLAPYHLNLGLAYQASQKLDAAIASYRRALQLQPEFAEVHFNLANALKEQGRVAEAVACYRRAIELKPDFAEAHCNLGNALLEQRNLDEAAASCRRALQLKPVFAEAYQILGNALLEQAAWDEAAACYRRALKLKPDFAEAHMGLATLELLRGDFQHGWPEYEWRWRGKFSSPRTFQQPRWDGFPLAGKTILLQAEQGLGDTIQFVRYAPLVKQLGSAVILECQKPLLSLLATCPGIDRLVAQGDILPDFDTHAPLLSLPTILHTSLDTIPAAVPYLFAAPPLVESWREKLREVHGYKIGISWHGQPRQGGWRIRNVPLQRFAALAAIPGVRLISLQKGAGREELAEISRHFPVLDLGDDLDQAAGAFMDTAAIMMNLDLVITSDTALPHLAGALGAAVWVALPFAADWRWLMDRSDSPWYPTMRLFRQKISGDWAGVFHEIEDALRERRASI